MDPLWIENEKSLQEKRLSKMERKCLSIRKAKHVGRFPDPVCYPDIQLFELKSNQYVLIEQFWHAAVYCPKSVYEEFNDYERMYANSFAYFAPFSDDWVIWISDTHTRDGYDGRFRWVKFTFTLAWETEGKSETEISDFMHKISTKFEVVFCLRGKLTRDDPSNKYVIVGLGSKTDIFQAIREIPSFIFTAQTERLLGARIAHITYQQISENTAKSEIAQLIKTETDNPFHLLERSGSLTVCFEKKLDGYYFGAGQSTNEVGTWTISQDSIYTFQIEIPERYKLRPSSNQFKKQDTNFQRKALALFRAANSFKVDYVRKLLERGADADVDVIRRLYLRTGRDIISSPFIVCMSTLLYDEPEMDEEQYECLRLLLLHGAKLEHFWNGESTGTGYSLVFACNNCEIIDKINQFRPVKTIPAYVYEKGTYRNLAVSFSSAYWNNDMSLVQAYLNFGFDVNCVDMLYKNSEITLRQFCATKQGFKMVPLPKIYDSKFLDFLLQNGYKFPLHSREFHSAQQIYATVVKYSLLHVAILQKDTELIRFALQNGANRYECLTLEEPMSRNTNGEKEACSPESLCLGDIELQRVIYPSWTKSLFIYLEPDLQKAIKTLLLIARRFGVTQTNDLLAATVSAWFRFKKEQAENAHLVNGSKIWRFKNKDLD